MLADIVDGFDNDFRHVKDLCAGRGQKPRKKKDGDAGGATEDEEKACKRQIRARRARMFSPCIRLTESVPNCTFAAAVEPSN